VTITSSYRSVVTLAVGLIILAAIVPAEAQQPKKVPHIGFVGSSGDPSNPGRLVKAFQQGLRELGYVEGKNILVDYRYAHGNVDRLSRLTVELVQLKVDVLVLQNLLAIRAAKQATKTIPIVMLIADDPVETGLIHSLPRPGGNVTGVARLTRELGGKRLELLKEVIPMMSRVGILRGATRDAEASGPFFAFKEYETAAHALKIQLQSLGVRGPKPDFESAFQAAVKGRVNALIAVRNRVVSRHSKQIAQFAVKYHLPSMYEGNQYVEAGGLMSYASNDSDLFRRVAVYVDKILKGAKPAELPVEQPTKFELVINLKTAKQIGLTIPPHVLARADNVIK
jgi:putative tryptophan/tyrosine transport system substrate-binding protein